MPTSQPLAKNAPSIICLDAPITEQSEAQAWRSHLDFVNSATEQNPALLIVPFSDLDQAKSFAAFPEVKSCWQIVAACYKGASGSEPEIAATIAAAIAAESDPALPYNGVELDLPVVAEEHKVTNTDIEQGLQSGVCMIALNASNRPAITRLITTYQVDKDGADDDLMLDVNAALVARYMRILARRVIQRNPRRKNSERERKQLRRELLAECKKAEEAEIIENLTGNEKELVVRQNPNVKTDTIVRIPTHWIRGMHVKDTYIDIY